MRVELDAFDSGLGLGGQVERIVVGEIDRADLLEDLHGARELRRVLGARGKDCLDLVVMALIRQGVHGNERAFTLGDVGAEVLVGGLFGADQVEQVVLNLKGKASICSSLPPPIMAPAASGVAPL